jgi:tetratricopeptide (TPR) repeat protein
MTTTFLEERLAANPSSPLFARLASCYLKEGQVQRAIDLCVDGLKRFPDYSTAHLVLGQCYEALGRDVEALIEYRQALRSVPDNAHVRTLVQRAEQREREAFRAFAEERVRKLSAKKGTLTFREFVDGPVETGADEEVLSTGGTIVTATLAEIYATQGEYAEAIRTYKRLSMERPQEAAQYARRITELEELERAREDAE